jgi:cyclopropane fatty-acyl-phospholipid synthase-like methyltransferase
MLRDLAGRLRLRWRYRGGYLKAYRASTDDRVRRDPHEAVGGQWDTVGPLQCDFLVEQGLEPGHRMLDIGCGTLRGGRFFIRHLDPGRYTGMDISTQALDFARELIEEKGLADRVPKLVLNEDLRLNFEELAGQQFDVLLAQSVFTHLQTDQIDECFANLPAVMAPGARFYFTFREATDFEQQEGKDFRQPYSLYVEIAERRGFELERLPEYARRHPRGQEMGCARRSS